MKVIFIPIATLLVLFILTNVLILFSANGQLLYPVKHTTEKFVSQNISIFPKALYINGSKILNIYDDEVKLRGIMFPDPAKLRSRNKLSKNLFENLILNIKEAGANVIRVPVQPDYWDSDKDYIWRNLSPIVEIAGKLGMYVIIDWHCIGNIDTGKGNGMPNNKNTKTMTYEFWESVSKYFSNTPNVIFEIFNEPQDIIANDWRENAIEIIKKIRDLDVNNLIIVGSPEFSSNLSWINENHIQSNNILYSVHIFQSHSCYKWDSLFGQVSNSYPILVTEWGYMDENRNQTKQSYLIGDEESFGKPFIEYLEKHNIGWIACWYDYEWEPPMFNQDKETLTNWGQFVIAQLKNKSF